MKIGIFHLLVHAPDAHNSWGRGRRKPSACSSIRVTGGRQGPAQLNRPLLPPRCVGQKQTLKWSSWDLNQAGLFKLHHNRNA